MSVGRLDPPQDFDPRLPADLVPGARALKRGLSEGGSLMLFALGVLRDVPASLAHTSEIVRHARGLITGTMLLTLFLISMLGGVTALFGSYVLRSLGASDYVGVFTAFSGTRAAVPIMFGYAFAAKVCCGLVAEIGSMRISDELEAYESVGLDPRRFVVATRIVAVWLFVPVIFCLSSLTMSLAQGFFVANVVGEVSYGNWASVHWAMGSLQDQLFSFIEVWLIATGTALVGCYYGFTVRGGPPEVGIATGRSMVLNLVYIHLVFGIGSLAFFGTDPLLPLGAAG